MEPNFGLLKTHGQLIGVKKDISELLKENVILIQKGIAGEAVVE